MEEIIVVLNSKSDREFLEKVKLAIQELDRCGKKIEIYSDDCIVSGAIYLTDRYKSRPLLKYVITLVQVNSSRDMSRLANDERCYYFHNTEELQDLLVYFCEIGLEKFLKIGEEE